MTALTTSTVLSSLLKRVIATAAVLAIVAEAAGLLLGATRQTLLSIPAGAVAAVGSFLVLALVVSHSAAGAAGKRGRGSVAAVAIIGCIKLALIGVALWWLINRALIEPLAFLAGFSTMVAALLFEGFRSHDRTIARSNG